MGMDVYGKKPTTEAGGYFRNNVWWWRPLAAYILDVAPENLTSKCHAWHSNDGAGLGARDSKTLAKFLRAEIASGRTAEYKAATKARIASIPRQPCEYCEGTGIRHDAVGLDYGWPSRTVTGPADNPRLGQLGSCNACEGWGTREPWEANYPFETANVEEFCTFLEGCGGFKIC